MLRGRPGAAFGALATGTGCVVWRTSGAGRSDAAPGDGCALAGGPPSVCSNAATAKRTDALAASAAAKNLDTTAARESASSNELLAGGVEDRALILPPGAPRRATSHRPSRA